jgi:hypothetical protein
MSLLNSIIINGKRVGYTLEEIIQNLYYYFLINGHDNINNIINLMKDLIIKIEFDNNRRSRRQQFFTQVINNLVNILNNQEENEKVNITESEFDEKFNSTTHTFASIKNGEYNINLDHECAICKTEFDDETNVTILKCSKDNKDSTNNIDHCFHTDCIKEWMTCHHANCPLCKTRYV